MRKILKNPGALVSGIALSSMMALPAYANDSAEDLFTIAESAECIDLDGDGWGWDGSMSCRVMDLDLMRGACVDYDGDGWGWDGVESCQIPGFVPVASECVDYDGDGFGWDGVETCIPGVEDAVTDDNPPEETGQEEPVQEEFVEDDPVLEEPVQDEPDQDEAEANALEAARMAFNSELEGVRSYGCSPGAEGQFTTEFVEVFFNGQTSSDIWLYEEPDCNSRPLTVKTALPLQSYMLENPVVTADGRDAFEVQLETLQVSSEAGDGAFPVGTVLFDIFALEQGGVTQGTAFATTAEERPLDLLTAGTATPVGARADAATAAGLMNTWRAECFNGRVQERTFDDQQLVERVDFYADDACESFIASRFNTWNVTYKEAVTTVFGQPALRTFTELVSSRYGIILSGPDLPEPPPLSQVGLMFEDIWGVIGDELVIGTCLDKRPGGCGSADNVPDILNYNVGNRFVRQ